MSLDGKGGRGPGVWLQGPRVGRERTLFLCSPTPRKPTRLWRPRGWLQSPKCAIPSDLESAIGVWSPAL